MILINVTACGDVKKQLGLEKGRGSSNTMIQPFTRGDAIKLPLNDSFCQSSQATALASDTITPVAFGYQDQTISNMSFSEIQQTSQTNRSFKVVTDPQVLKLCSSETPAEGTIEDAALKALGHFDRAAHFYRSVTQETLKPLSLLMLPLLETRLNISFERDKDDSESEGPEDFNLKERFYMTDNASWSFMDDQFVFTIFPQSKVALEQGLFGGEGMWDSPYVMAHEYGHHVFYNLYKEVYADTDNGLMNNLKGNRFANTTLGPIDRMPEPFGDHHFKANAMTDRSFFDIVGALNEGFSDMYSLYSLNEPTLDAMDCFAQTRDINTPAFGGGLSKGMTEAMINQMFYHEGLDLNPQGVDDDTCGLADLSTVHHVGAVIAHNVHQLFNVTVAEQNQGEALDVAKSKLLFSWIRTLVSRYEDGEWGPKKYLRDIIASAIITASAEGQLSEGQCQVISDQFPHYASIWNQSENQELPMIQACP